MYTRETELFHHGVKGQQWGVKNGPPYPLSDKQKKKISKQYKKLDKKASKEGRRAPSKSYVNVYNKTANQMNNKEISRFNERYGEVKDEDDYAKEYNKLFNAVFAKNQCEMSLSDIKNNTHMQEAMKLCDKYDMTSWDELAKSESYYYNLIKNDYKAAELSYLTATGETEKANKMMKQLEKDYTVEYDESSGLYSLYEKEKK